MRKIICAIITLSLFLSATMAKDNASALTLTLQNPLPLPRTVSEMAEVEFPEAKQQSGRHWIAITEKGDTLPCQVTYDNKIIFQCPPLQAKGKLTVRLLSTDITTNNDQTHSTRVFGRLYPERQSDFSFENDRIAYRIYGPATQKKGERLYGYDIFLKRVPQMILNTLYARQCDNNMWSTVDKLRRIGQRELADDVYQYGFCYHVDHGEGMDIYKVGATLGAGTNALTDSNGNIIYPWCFNTAELLDSGPLRLTVRLTFAPTKINDTEVVETRLLTIDAGSQMVKAQVSYSLPNGNALPPELSPCAGIAIHKENPKAYIIDKQMQLMAYDDLGDPDIYRKKDHAKLNPQKGNTFIGCIMPDADDFRFIPFDKERNGAIGHVAGTAHGKTTLTYYFGYAWNLSPLSDIRSMEAWQQYLKQFRQQVLQPLKTKTKG